MNVSQIARSNTDEFVKVCISACMCACTGVRIMTRTRSNKEHSEPHGTTLALNYIMPFNSSTPKIDGYCNSSVLATARRKKKGTSAGISQMGNARLWLRSGLQVYANNRKQLNSACQPKSRKYCTHILFTASPPRVEEKKKVTLQTQSCLRGARTDPTAPLTKKTNKSDTIPSG